jgi:hypothetical protein
MSALSRPNNRRSGANRNSMTFMVATRRIWKAQLHLQRMPLKIHAATKTSPAPMRQVSPRECSSPRIRATISRWRWTPSNSLHQTPLINQTGLKARQRKMIIFSVSEGGSTPRAPWETSGDRMEMKAVNRQSAPDGLQKHPMGWLVGARKPHPLIRCPARVGCRLRAHCRVVLRRRRCAEPVGPGWAGFSPLIGGDGRGRFKPELRNF